MLEDLSRHNIFDEYISDYLFQFIFLMKINYWGDAVASTSPSSRAIVVQPKRTIDPNQPWPVLCVHTMRLVFPPIQKPLVEGGSGRFLPNHRGKRATADPSADRIYRLLPNELTEGRRRCEAYCLPPACTLRDGGGCRSNRHRCCCYCCFCFCDDVIGTILWSSGGVVLMLWVCAPLLQYRHLGLEWITLILRPK